MSNASRQLRAFALPRFESMEVRRLLATVVVDTLADETIANTTTSLREALQLAAAGDTVQFKVGLTGQVTLAQGELRIRQSLAIVGPGAAVLTVSGNGIGRVFQLAGDITASISGLTIADGYASYGGGVYSVAQGLALSKVKFVNNRARGADGKTEGKAYGDDGRGGAVYADGDLSVTDCTFDANAAIGGNGAYGVTGASGGDAAGGAIYAGDYSSVVLTRTKFVGNEAAGGDGGWVAGDTAGFGGGATGGAVSGAAGVEVVDVTFVSNCAVGGAGADAEFPGFGGNASGGALNGGWGAVLMSRCTLTGNGAVGGFGGRGSPYAYGDAFGGAAAGGAISTSSDLSADQSTFAGNYAVAGNRSQASGGAINTFGDTAIAQCTIAGNTAKVAQRSDGDPGWEGGRALGGGVYFGGMTNSLTFSSIVNNAAVAGPGGPASSITGSDAPAGPGGDALGGALYVQDDLSVRNSTIASNTAKGGAGGAATAASTFPGGDGGSALGGAIFIPEAGVSIFSSTIALNKAIGGAGGAGMEGPTPRAAGRAGIGLAGGVYNRGSVTFGNTIVARNEADIGVDIEHVEYAPPVSKGHNLIGSRTATGGWIASDLTGTDAAPLDPLLGALADNGGPTKTMLPLAGSPVIDKGNAFQTLDDQRRLPRIYDFANVSNANGGDGTDIGAVELQPTPYGGVAAGIAATGTSRIDAERFDNGGEGVGYHDTDATNVGAAYRQTGVDIQPTSDTGGGFNVGWTRAGEWLTYAANVARTGAYDLAFRVASNGAGGNFHLEVDGKNVTGSLTVPNTLGWQTWKTLAKSGVNLPAGRHVLRLVMDSVGATGWVGNFNYLQVKPATAQQVTIATATAAHVRDGSYRGVNYGSSPTLEVKKSTTGYNRETFLKFDLDSVSSISNAKLRLYGKLTDTAAASIQLAVIGAADKSWSETTLTWNNKPAAATPAATLAVSGTTARWYEVDLTAYLSAQKAAGKDIVTLALRSNTSTSTLCQFNSDEAATNRPQLVVTT